MPAWNEGSARGTPLPPVPFSPWQAAQLRAYRLAPFRCAWACEQPNPPNRIKANRRSSMSVSLRSITIHKYLNIYSKPVNPQNKPISRDRLPGHAKICAAEPAIAPTICYGRIDRFCKAGTPCETASIRRYEIHASLCTHNDERTDQLDAPRTGIVAALRRGTGD